MGHVPREHHLGGVKPLLVVEGPERVHVLAPPRRLPHQQEPEVGGDEALPVRGQADEVVVPLVGHHPPHEEDVGAAVLEQPPQHGVGLLAVAAEVEVDGQHSRAREAQVLELAAVELAVGQGEVHVAEQARELLPADLADPRQLVVPAGEELGGRDVVVEQDPPPAVLAQGRGQGRGQGEVEDDDVLRSSGPPGREAGGRRPRDRRPRRGRRRRPRIPSSRKASRMSRAESPMASPRWSAGTHWSMRLMREASQAARRARSRQGAEVEREVDRTASTVPDGSSGPGAARGSRAPDLLRARAWVARTRARRLGSCRTPWTSSATTSGALLAQQDPAAVQGLAHRPRVVGDHGQAEVHGLLQGHAEALVLGEAEEEVRRRGSRPRGRRRPRGR